MKQVRVNVRTAVNTAAIRRETRDGREVIVVPSATLPDGVVMNSILYEAGEIDKAYRSLERTPAPLGHPRLNGRFVSASDPEGLARGFIGAWNENVRREGGRVLIDKVIDVAFASQTEGGKAVLNAIDKGGPIHTSTGLLCKLEPCNSGGASHIARDIIFDHDAILLNEAGAATPEQGVGMLVNRATGEEIEVVNSVLEDAERELDWAVDHLARALEKRGRVPWLDQIKTAVMGLLPMREITNERKDEDMSVSKEQFDGLSAQVNTLAAAVDTLTKGLPDLITNAVKPMADHVAEMQANAKAAADVEKAGLVDKVVKANLLSESAAKELTVNALKELAAKVADPGKAAALNSAFGGTQASDDFAGYDLNALLGEKK